MGFEIPANLGRKLIADPVEAAFVIMGAELDDFQRARLRTAWFTPVTLDHSGISTAKSEVAFIFAFLRLILLPNPPQYLARVVGVYYQNQGAAQETFLPKIGKYCEKSKIFESQLKPQRRGEYHKNLNSCIVIEMRNGGRLELPSGDFSRDSKNQASKRINDLILDETGEMDKMGDGINKQLLGRKTLECFNPNHPVWCNHTLFFGHAESPDHPYHKRYAAIRNKARRGSQQNATFCADYRDYRGEFKKRFGQEAEKEAKNQQDGILDESEFAWIWLGLWKRGTMGWYSKTLRDGIKRLDVRPQLKREKPLTQYFLGWDTAGGMKSGADFNAGTVVAADPVDGPPREGEAMEGFMEMNGRWWFVRPVYAVFLFSKTVDQLSGVIHRLHQAFNFTGITLDSQGGGAFVYKKLVESRQFINNEWVNLRGGLCMPADQFNWPMAEPIVSFFDRGDPLFRDLFGEKFLKDNTGPIDFAHRTVRSFMSRGSIAWPADKERRDREPGLEALSVEQLEVLASLDKVLTQFGGIGVRVDKQKLPVKSANGFQQFVNTGKKDGAMSAIYAMLRAVCEMKRIRASSGSKSAAGFFT